MNRTNQSSSEAKPRIRACAAAATVFAMGAMAAQAFAQDYLGSYSWDMANHYAYVCNASNTTFGSSCGDWQYYKTIDNQISSEMASGIQPGYSGPMWMSYATPTAPIPFVGPLASPDGLNQVWIGRRATFMGVFMHPPFPSVYGTQPNRLLIVFEGYRQLSNPGEYFDHVQVIARGEILSGGGDGIRLYRHSDFGSWDGLNVVWVYPADHAYSATWDVPGQVYSPARLYFSVDGIYTNAYDWTNIDLTVFADKYGPCSAPPPITSQPQNQTACAGYSAYFSINDSGRNIVSRQWQWSTDPAMGVWTDVQTGLNTDPATGVPLFVIQSGANSFIMLVTVMPGIARGPLCSFRCIASNPCGATTSDPAILSVETQPPVIESQPMDASTCPTGEADFTIGVTGPGSISYQWQLVDESTGQADPVFDGPIYASTSYDRLPVAIVSGTNQATMHVIALPSAGGRVRFDCYVANVCNAIESQSAELSVCFGTSTCDGRVDADLRTFTREYFYGASAFDASRNQMVAAGGFYSPSNQPIFTGTWTWDGSQWHNHQSASYGPGAVYGGAMAYDEAHHAIIAFGGYTGSVFPAYSSLWDGENWIFPGGTQPPPTYLHAMSYDSDRGRVVLFGGYNGSYSNQTWEWDGANWAHVSSSGPSQRQVPSMAYDSVRHQTVMFGGQDYQREGDTWLWDGSSWMHASDSGPAPRIHHKMAFDSARGKVVLFGGNTDAGYTNDLWEWDGAAWSQISSIHSPGARAYAYMAADPVHHTIILMGGASRSLNFGDTWVWDGSDWAQVSDADPTNRDHAVAAYNPVRDTVVMFGGYDGTNALGDMLEWNGTFWKAGSAIGSAPPARAASAMAFDSAGGKMVLFGGTNGHGGSAPNDFSDTWEMDGSSMTWSNVTPSNSADSPSQRYGHAMAFDPVNQKVMVFGGNDGTGNFRNDTWEWDGARWLLVATTGPDPRNQMRMVTDTLRNRVVLFGGNHLDNTNCGDTWEWDGAVWMQVASTGPSPRLGQGMTFDTVQGRTLLFGGQDTAQVYNDLWSWDGTVWREMNQTNASTSPRWAPVFVYEPARDETVVFGGSNATSGASTTLFSSTEVWTRYRVTIRTQPQDTIVCPTGSGMLSIEATGVNLSYQWRLDGNPIDPAANPSAATSVLRLTNLLSTDAGSYDCVISNECSSATSAAAVLTICVGDFNCDGGVDGSDVDAFFGTWENGDAVADVNADGGVDGSDVEYFFARWEGGC